MQRPPSFKGSTQQLPQARLSESTSRLIATAGNAANERRGQKSIMNCFRDRTPSYTRSNSHIARANGGLLSPAASAAKLPPLSPHYAADQPPTPRARPFKLTLLKASSTRDLSRLLELEESARLQHSSPPLALSSRNLSKMTSSSTSISSSSSTAGQCSASCSRHIQKLEQRIDMLEKQLSQQSLSSQSMATELQEIHKRMDAMSRELDAQSKRKKLNSRATKKENTTTPTGGLAVQPSKLVAWMRLSNFWKQRPSIQTLKEQNIYNDEPCFDTEIEMVLKDEVHKTVPKIVVDCCQLIEEKYRRSTEPIEGIYRQCGDYNKMQALRFSIDANNYGALKQPNVDIHTLAGLLKLFLREIKSPLVSTNEAKTFIGKPNQWVLTDLPNKLEILRRLIRSLPEVNRDTMEFLFAHFNKLTKVPLQHVSAETLAISVTPSIFHTVQQGARMQDIHTLLKESETFSDCVKIMIEYHQKIFDFSQNP